MNNGTKGDIYNYDSGYKLTQAFLGAADAKANVGNPVSTAFESRYEYNYDKVYNFTSDKKAQSSPVLNIERTYTSNNLNQYVAIGTVENGAPPVTESPVYDKNGNIIQDAKYLYAYNWRNQITEVNNLSDGSLVAKYNYDALGRRVSKLDAGIGEVTNYIYDGWQVIEERDASNQVKASYIYSGLDEPVAMLKEGTVYYYHYNRLGSIEAVTDAGGNVVERYEYDPFGGFKILDAGGVELSESQIGNRYYFTGREYDAETGLYNYRNRYYSPEKGRFMSLDPLGYADSLNAYAYVLSDPINWIDPFGLAKVSQNSYLGQVTGYPMSGPANFQTGNAWIDPTIGLANDAINLVNNVFYDSFAAIGGTIALIEDATGVSFNELYVASLSAPMPFEIDTVATYGLSRLSEIGRGAIERSGYLGRILASERGAVGVIEGPGTFSSRDVALGVHEYLSGFTGRALRGTMFPTPNGLKLGLEAGIRGVVENGGRIRFNLRGVDVEGALRPGSPVYGTVTSWELRLIKNDPILFENTVFYNERGKIVDSFK